MNLTLNSELIYPTMGNWVKWVPEQIIWICEINREYVHSEYVHEYYNPASMELQYQDTVHQESIHSASLYPHIVMLHLHYKID